MNSLEVLKRSVPYETNCSYIFNEVFNADANKFDEIEVTTKDFLMQLFPQTATWGLAIWEKLCGLTINPKLSIEARRGKIITKLSRISPMTIFELKRILSYFADTIDVKEYPNDYSFDVTFGSYSSIGDKLSEMYEIIEEVKPAHLDFRAIFDYVTVLNIIVNFNVWYTGILPRCGTIACKEDEVDREWIATNGYRFNEEIINPKTVKKYLSDTLNVVYEDNYIIEKGKSYNKLLYLTANIYDYFSSELNVAAQDNFILGISSVSQKTIEESLTKYLSSPIEETEAVLNYNTQGNKLSASIETNDNTGITDTFKYAYENETIEEDDESDN